MRPDEQVGGGRSLSRRVHACVSCPGRTRHRGPCAACRRRGVTLVRDAAVGPRVMLRLLTDLTDVRAPTVAELDAGADLTRFLTAKEIR